MSDQYQLLLVEDDSNLGSILKEYLVNKGFNADWYRNGQEALNQYFEKDYDLLILDVMLPKMDGFTIAKEIRKDPGYPPILFLTGKSQ